MSKKTKRVQEGRWTVQFPDAEFRARLMAVAKAKGLCVATLIRTYTMDGVAFDERNNPRCVNKST